MMNKKDKDKVNYFTTYIDKNGLQHYAVHAYNRLSGVVDRMSDNKNDKEPTYGMQA